MRFVPLCIWLLLAQQAMGREVSPVRVATFNLNCRNQHQNQILDAIKATKADVLFLQETTVASERFLAIQLKDAYPHFYATGYIGRFAEERLAFVSRLPLEGVTYSPPSKGFFGFYTATCKVGGKSVQLINVHLTPFVIRPGTGVTDVLAEIKGTENRHASEVAEITRKIDVAKPVIIAGDFNSLSTFAAPSLVSKMGFTDSFAAIHAKPDTHPTWRGIVDSTVLPLRLDYIFHTRQFHTVKSEIIERGGSDHFPVVSELRLIEQADAVNEDRPILGETNSTSSATNSSR